MLMPHSCCGEIGGEQLLLHRVVLERNATEVGDDTLEGGDGETAVAIEIDRRSSAYAA